MSDAKKYKMRPGKRLPNGKLVPIHAGGNSFLTAEGEHAVTPALHTAWRRGDVEIDDYDEGKTKPARKKAGKKRAAKKAAEKPDEKPAADKPAKTEDK